MIPQLAGPETANDPAKRWGASGFIRFGLICVLILGGGVGGWAATASLKGAVVATGQLRVETNRQVVQHPDGGVVSEIMARDGSTVAAGDILIRLDPTELASQLIQLESQLFEVMARRGRLEAVMIGADQIDFDPELTAAATTSEDVGKLMMGQVALFRARGESQLKQREIMAQRQQQLREQIAGAETEVAALTRQVELIAKELVGMRKLQQQGLARANQVLALEREEARLQGETGQLLGQIASLKGQISEIDVELSRMDATTLEEAIAESRELGFRELEFKEQRTALKEQLSRLEIRAPRSGVVIDSTVHALKAVVRPAEPIMYVIPNDTELVVDAQIDPLNVDQMYRGQEAVLRFSAFNTRTTPEVFGSITKVSADTITDEQTGLTFYKAEIKLNEGELVKLEEQELVAGMPVEVYVQTGERTPINYLMKPITDYFNRAWRED
jgi:HlyD family secretion protein